MSDETLIPQLERSIAIVQAGGKPSEVKAQAIQRATEDAKQAAAIQRKQEEIAFLSQFDELDWRKMRPPILAALLRARAFPPAMPGDPMRHLSKEQAIITATWLFRHDFHPASHEWWFNWDTGLPEMSVEGKLSKARTEGWRLGAPKYRRIPEDRKEPLEAYECRLPAYIVDIWQEYQYVAELSLFSLSPKGTPKKGLWANPGGKEHMLRVRALDGCLKQIGYGFSEPIGDDSGETPPSEITISPAVNYKPQGGK